MITIYMLLQALLDSLQLSCRLTPSLSTCVLPTPARPRQPAKLHTCIRPLLQQPAEGLMAAGCGSSWAQLLHMQACQ